MSLALLCMFVVGVSCLHTCCAGPVRSADSISDANGHGRRLAFQKSDEAYVTMLYGDSPEFILGVRVLASSLRNSKTDKNLVVLCTEDVTEVTREVLLNDGWIVKSVNYMKTPYKNSAFFTKLLIWTLKEYKKILYIDSDALVLQNVDHVFSCGNFCAVYRHSDRFNAGVLVMKPSLEVFNDMKSLLGTLYSYDGGDQGFLNAYFERLKFATIFSKDEIQPSAELMRLPTGYNADIGFYYLSGAWIVPVEEQMILHYTLGPVKPWKWWSYPMFDLNWQWNALRRQLSPHYYEPSLWSVMNMLPVVILSVLVVTSQYWMPCYQIFERHIVIPLCNNIDPVSGWSASLFHIPVLCVSCYFAFYRVPITLSPVEAWILYVIWIFFFLALFYFPYCHMACSLGHKQKLLKQRHYLSARTETLFWALVLASSAVLSLSILWFTEMYVTRVKLLGVILVLYPLFVHQVGRRVVQIWYRHGSRR